MAAPVDGVGGIRFVDLPRVAVHQPVVGLLDLPAVGEFLLEDAELVADAVADRRALQRGHRVQVAGRQPAQPAVAQARFALTVQDHVEVLAEIGQRLTRLRLDAQIEQVVAQLRAHQELRGQVAGDLARQIQPVLGGRHPAFLHAVAHRQGERLVVVLGGEHRRRAGDRIDQMIGHRGAQRVGGHAGTGLSGGGEVGAVVVGGIFRRGGHDVGHCVSWYPSLRAWTRHCVARVFPDKVGNVNSALASDGQSGDCRDEY